MPNVHLQEAARNIQRAVGDIDLKISQIRAEIENKNREAEAQIRGIEQQKLQLRGQMAVVDSDTERASILNDIKDRDRQISEIRQEISRARDEQRRSESDLSSQRADLQALSTQLAMDA